MNILGLLGCIIILLIFLLAHSYFKRGFRITFNLTLFALIVAINQQIGNFFAPAIIVNNLPPFFFSTQNINFVFSFLVVILGWVFTFYVGWALAEKILERLECFQNKIFPTLLFAGLVTASISYAVETIGINIGWWKWSFYDKQFSVFLVGGLHFFAVKVWFFFSINFLITFFLVECSKFRESNWKGVFFIIPFIYIWLSIFRGESFVEIERICLLLLVIVLAFFSNMKFDIPTSELPKKTHIFDNEIFQYIPVFSITIVVIVLIFLCLVSIRNTQLLVAIIPVTILALLSIKRINLSLIMCFLIISSIYSGIKIMPTIAVISIFLIFNFVNRIKLLKY